MFLVLKYVTRNRQIKITTLSTKLAALFAHLSQPVETTVSPAGKVFRRV